MEDSHDFGWLAAKCSILNRMLDIKRSADKMAKIVLTTDFKRDLNWFLNFIPKFNGIAFIAHNPITEKK